MTEALTTDYLQLEARDPMERSMARYFFDLRPEYVDTERFTVLVFKASECRGNGLTPELPSDGTEETPRASWSFPVTPDEDRPAGTPLRVTGLLPYLEPRYGDTWVAFVVELTEEEEG